MGNQQARQAVPTDPYERLVATTRERGAMALARLSRTPGIGDVNLYLIDQPGTDVVALGDQLTQLGRFRRPRPGAANEALARAAAGEMDGTQAERWSNPVAALRWLCAHNVAMQLPHLPDAQADYSLAEQTGSRNVVRIFTQSALEDAYVALPCMLTGTELAEPAALVLRCGAATAEQTCPRGCSLWIYVRLQDDIWERRCRAHVASGAPYAERTVERWRRWRSSADAMMLGDVGRTRHTLQITVHTDVLTSPVALYDIAYHIAAHIEATYASGAWGSHVGPGELAAHLQRAEAQARRFVVAAQTIEQERLRPSPTLQ